MSNSLTELSDALADTVSTAGANVVRVEARDRIPASGIIWSRDGLVVTAHHVVERDDRIIVGLPEGETLAAELVGRDAATDLALLRVQGGDLSVPAWAEPEGLRVGHLVLALGRPGSSVQATMGIIGALGNSWRTPSGGSIDRYLQTDLVMPPGFSGGPLVDATGQIAGLNSSALVRGVPVAIPFPTIGRTVESLLAHGRIRRAYIGVGSQPTRLPEGVASQLDQQTGLLLVSVEPGGPAEKGGLFLGDALVSVAGNPVRHMDDLMVNLSGDQIGKSVPVRIVRAGQLHDLAVVPSERPER